MILASKTPGEIAAEMGAPKLPTSPTTSLTRSHINHLPDHSLPRLRLPRRGTILLGQERTATLPPENIPLAPSLVVRIVAVIIVVVVLISR